MDTKKPAREEVGGLDRKYSVGRRITPYSELAFRLGGGSEKPIRMFY